MRKPYTLILDGKLHAFYVSSTKAKDAAVVYAVNKFKSSGESTVMKIYFEDHNTPQILVHEEKI